MKSRTITLSGYNRAVDSMRFDDEMSSSLFLKTNKTSFLTLFGFPLEASASFDQKKPEPVDGPGELEERAEPS